MDAISILGVIISFAGILIFLSWIKIKTKGSFQVTSTDIVLALLPIVIFLLLSNRIKTLKFGDLEIETAFKEAHRKNIEPQVNDLSVHTVPAVRQGGMDELREQLKRKPEALKLVVGGAGHENDALEAFLKVLAGSTVKHLVFENANNQFVGMVSLYDLNNQLLGDAGRAADRLQSFTHFLNGHNPAGIKSLLSGMLTLEHAVYAGTTRKDALAKIQQANSNFIPVVDRQHKLTGILEDSRLMASLLLDVSSGLDD
jgi:CBS domain-containing protein